MSHAWGAGDEGGNTLRAWEWIPGLPWVLALPLSFSCCALECEGSVAEKWPSKDTALIFLQLETNAKSDNGFNRSSPVRYLGELKYIYSLECRGEVVSWSGKNLIKSFPLAKENDGEIQFWSSPWATAMTLKRTCSPKYVSVLLALQLDTSLWIMTQNSLANRLESRTFYRNDIFPNT